MGSSKLFKRLGIALTGMALAIGVGVGLSQRGEYKEARAAEVEAYSLTCTNTYSNTGNTAYASTYDVVVSGKTWNAPGNQNYEGYWRIGGAKGTNVQRFITGKSSLSDVITKITVNHNGVSNASLTINSVSVSVASSTDFVNDLIETKIVNNPSVTSGNADSFDFSPTTSSTWASGSYYKFTFDYTHSVSKNYGLDVTSIVFYKTVTGYTVSFDKGEGTGSMSNVEKTGNYTLPESTFTAPEGKTFKCWNDGVNDYFAGDTYNVTAAVTLTAQYDTTVALSFNNNGGTGSKEAINYATGGRATAPENPFTKAGYVFDHWNTKEDNTGFNYNQNETFTINAATTLYAQWELCLDITISNFTEITASYTTVFTHSYTVATFNSTTSMNVSAYGVYKNNAGIQTRGDDGAYIKNTNSLPSGAYITTVVCTWTTTGRNSPTLYVSKDSVASSSSTKIAKGNNTELIQTFSITNASTNKYNYFYLDLSTITDTCYMSDMKVYYDFADELSSIVVNATQQQLTYTSGDTFSFAGSVTPTRLLSGEGSSTTSNLSFKLAGNDITVGTTVLTRADNGKTLTVYYTENGVTKSANAPYNIIVNYCAVTSITLDSHAESIGLTGSVALSATISTSEANPAVSWNATPSAGLVEDTNYEIVTDGNAFLLSMKNNNSTTGTITVTATATGYIDDENTPDLRDTCVITISASKTVSLDNSELDGYTTQTATITATPNNFVSPSYAWTITSGNDKVSIISGANAATVTIRYEAAGDATVKCVVTDSNDDTAEASCDVSITASVIDGVSWSGSNFTCFAGESITAEMVEDWLPSYHMNNGSSDVILSDYQIKLNGTNYTLGTPLTLSDSGKTVTLTYAGFTTAENNPVVTVKQNLNTINAYTVNEYTWVAAEGALGTKIESPATSTSGTSSVKINNGNMSYERTVAYVKSGSSDYVGTSGSYIQLGSANALETFTLSTSAVSGTIKAIVINYGAKDGGTTISVTVGSTSYGSKTGPSWVASSGSDVTFTGNASGTISITFEADKKTSGKAQYLKSVTVIAESGVQSNIANTNVNAQEAVISFAQYLNTQMNGENVCSGTFSALSTAWTNVKNKYEELFGAGTTLSASELLVAKSMMMYANANWNESHDSDQQYCLERAMATYEYCVRNHSVECPAFMNTVRPVGRVVGNEIMNFAEADSNMIIVIAVVSAASLLTIGGYFFIRRRKER